MFSVSAGARSATALAALLLVFGPVSARSQVVNDPPGGPFVIGQGALAGNGGWIASRSDGPAFQQQSWRELPWPDYKAAGGAVHPAMGDVDGDGRDEVVLGLAAGGNGWIAVLDDNSREHALLAWVQVPLPGYNLANGTVFPAVGDVDGDGRAEIVAGLGKGSAGWFAIFDDAAAGYALLAWQQVQWPNYTAGPDGRTQVAVGDLNGDGTAEIVVGLGPGSNGWIEVFNGAAGAFSHRAWLQVQWAAYNAANGTVYPAAGDLDGDGRAEIVAGLGAGGAGWFESFEDERGGYHHRRWGQVPWPAYAAAVGATHPAVGNVDGDPAAEILIGLAAYSGDGGWFAVFDDLNAGASHVAWRNLDWVQFRAAGGATYPAIGEATDGLLASYPFTGSAQDTSGNGNHGAPSNVAPATDRFGIPGRAFSFNGVSSRVEVTGLPALTGDFSISFWEKSLRPDRMHAVSLGRGVSDHLDIDFNDDSGALAYWNSSGSGVQWIAAGPEGELTDNGWHHVVLTRSGSRVELYVDATLRGWTNATGTFNTERLLRLGRGSYDTWWWHGLLDDVLIYRRALDPSEIASLNRDRPLLALLSPAGGAQWSSGSVQNITWTADVAVSTVRLDYSLDNGATWHPIATSVAAAPGQYAWTIPAAASRLALVRVADASNPTRTSLPHRFVLLNGTQTLWQRVTDDAQWGPRDGPGVVVFNGRMWLLGGWHPTEPFTYNEIWSSADGATWRFEGRGPWSGTHTCGCVVFDDRMWIIGGNGYPDVWVSADGVQWTLALAGGPWGQRYKPYVVVHGGKIWLMGGFDTSDLSYAPYNDVWSSTDGVSWTRVLAQAPWQARGAIHGGAVFDGRIWIIGGGQYPQPPATQERLFSDVWSSANGRDWTLVTSQAPWLPRIHHSTVVYADKLWVLAGHDADGLKNDVWVSEDGARWTELPGAPWSHRHAAATLVHNDTLWLMAGFLVNDIWKLSLAGNVVINDGAAATASTAVTLTLSPPDSSVDAVQFSNDGVLWTQPEAYARTRSWTVPAGAGSKTVHVRFRVRGAWTQAYTDGILYNGT